MKISKLIQNSKDFLDNKKLSQQTQNELKNCVCLNDIKKVSSSFLPIVKKRQFKYGLSGGEGFSDEKLKQCYPDEIFYWFVPEKYSEKPFGLFVFMHGGDANSPKTAPAKYLKKNKMLRPHIDNASFITVAPSAPTGRNGSRWNQKGTSNYIIAVIEEACQRYNIDRSQIFLGGHSMGGFGAYHNCQLLGDRLAGAFLSAGAWRIANFKAFTAAPVYILHGKYDCAAAYREFHKTPRHHSWCGVSYARAAHQLLEEAGVEHQYDEHDGGHGLKWEPSQLAFLRFLDWTKLQRRNTTASKVCAITPRGSGQFCLEDAPHCRWISINKVDGGKIAFDKIILKGPDIAWSVRDLAEQKYELEKIYRRGGIVDAENCGNNRFVIKTENIKSFSIWLNSEMIDFTKPVKVCLNGKNINVKATPSLYDTLRSYQRSNDWSNIFSSEIKFKFDNKI